MKLLLDTHILLWWSDGSSKLGKRAKELLLAEDSTLVMSAVSWWEIAIKQALGRLSFPFAPSRAALEAHGVATLNMTFDHAEAAAELPLHHKDPFDRMLVAQAKVEGLQLLTREKRLKDYGRSVLVV